MVNDLNAGKGANSSSLPRLYKHHIASAVAQRTGKPRAWASKVVSSFWRHVAAALLGGETVHIKSLGTFTLREGNTIKFVPAPSFQRRIIRAQNKRSVRMIADETGVEWNDVVSIIYAMTDYMTEKIAEGHPVRIMEFGQFKLIHARELLTSKYIGSEYWYSCGFSESPGLRNRLKGMAAK